MLKRDSNDLKPCPHMQTLVSAWLDGKLSGLMRWYTAWHVAHCPRCTDAVPVLRLLRDRLRRLSHLPDPDEALTPERRAAVEAGWEKADQVSGVPPAL